MSSTNLDQLVYQLLDQSEGGTCEQLLSAICQQFNIADLSSFLTKDQKSVYQASPTLFEHMQLQCRVAGRVVSAVLSRPIVTIYDLEIQISQAENVSVFSQLKLGTHLWNLPDVQKYFSLLVNNNRNSYHQSTSGNRSGFRIRNTTSTEVIRFLLKTTRGLSLLWGKQEQQHDDGNQNHSNSNNSTATAVTVSNDVFDLVDGFARSVGLRRGYQCGIHIQDLQGFRNILRSESSRASSLESLCLLLRSSALEKNLIMSMPVEVNHQNNNQQRFTKQSSSTPVVVVVSSNNDKKQQKSSSSNNNDSISISSTMMNNNSNNNSSGLMISFGDDDEAEEEDKQETVGHKTPVIAETPIQTAKEETTTIELDQLFELCFGTTHGAIIPKDDRKQSAATEINFNDPWAFWNESGDSLSFCGLEPTAFQYTLFEALLLFQASTHFFKVQLPVALKKNLVFKMNNEDSSSKNQSSTFIMTQNNENYSAETEGGETATRTRRRGRYVNPETENAIQDRPSVSQVAKVMEATTTSSFIRTSPHSVPVHCPAALLLKTNTNYNMTVLYGFGKKDKVLIEAIIEKLEIISRLQPQRMMYFGFLFSTSASHTIPALTNTMETALSSITTSANENSNNNNNSSPSISFINHKSFIRNDVEFNSNDTDFMTSSFFTNSFSNVMQYLRPFLKKKFAKEQEFFDILDWTMLHSLMPGFQVVAVNAMKLRRRLTLNPEIQFKHDNEVSSWFVTESTTLFVNLSQCSSGGGYKNHGNNNNNATKSSSGYSVSVPLADGIVDLMLKELDAPEESPGKTLHHLRLLGHLRQYLIDFFSWSLFLSPEILNFEARSRGVLDVETSKEIATSTVTWQVNADWTGINPSKFKNNYPLTASGRGVMVDAQLPQSSSSASSSSNSNKNNYQSSGASKIFQNSSRKVQERNNQNNVNDDLPLSSSLSKVTKFDSSSSDDDDDDDDDEQTQNRNDDASSSASNNKNNNDNDNPFLFTMQHIFANPHQSRALAPVTRGGSKNNDNNNKGSKMDQVSSNSDFWKSKHATSGDHQQDLLLLNNGTNNNNHSRDSEERNRQVAARFAEYLTARWLSLMSSSSSSKTVEWVNQEVETGLPYDIVETYHNEHNRKVYIEVKSAWRRKTGGSSGNNDFYLTVREFAFAVQNPKDFHIIQIFGTSCFLQDGRSAGDLEKNMNNNKNNSNTKKQKSNISDSGNNNNSDAKSRELEQTLIESVKFRRTEQLFESWKRGDVRVEGQLAVCPTRQQ